MRAYEYDASSNLTAVTLTERSDLADVVLLGAAVSLPAIDPGDVVVACGHGAYTRSLIPPFNERERPVAVVLGV